MQSDLCLIVNIFSAEGISLSFRLSQSDWAQLRSILKKAGTEELCIKTEVDWSELETALIELPEITALSLREGFIIFTSEKVWINPFKSFGPFLESRNLRVGGSRKARVQTFSEKIFPLQMFTLESKKGWGAGV